MVQELISNKRVAIIGAGPAGCCCAKYLLDSGFDVTIFDKGKFLRTILPTGGGRCNLAYAQFDFKELAKNYPRGEKFLYSIFSKFGTQDTLDFFYRIGIETYVQDDNRFFPVSNSAKEVREKLLNSISKASFINEKILSITHIDNGYKLTSEKSKYHFDVVIIAIGGHSNFELVKTLDISIIEPTPALVGLICKEDFSSIAGVSLKNIQININKEKYQGDILFTHKGVSGPLIYKISSIKARDKFPYKLSLSIHDCINFQELLDKNPHKDIKNLLGQIIPKSLSVYILQKLNIDLQTPCHQINRINRDKIINSIKSFDISVTGKVPDGEVVTCGGVNLSEINSKTLESKKHSGLYFCGEVLDIDGFCGGFNLQNCWSTAYVVAQSLISR